MTAGRNRVATALGTLCAVAFISGCLFTPVSQEPPPGPPQPPDADAQLRSSVAEALKDVPRDQCLNAYGMFVVFSDFVAAGKYADNIKTTADLLRLWGRMVKIAEWEKEKHKALTDVVEAALKARGFETNKPVEDVRKPLSKVFRSVGMGCKDAALAPLDEE